MGLDGKSTLGLRGARDFPSVDGKMLGSGVCSPLCPKSLSRVEMIPHRRPTIVTTLQQPTI